MRATPPQLVLLLSVVLVLAFIDYISVNSDLLLTVIYFLNIAVSSESDKFHLSTFVSIFSLSHPGGMYTEPHDFTIVNLIQDFHY